ncbi:hypothetical protein L5M16_16295 [Shewanella sp. SM103]|nr:hypothetical protein [Shewanella sp. SM103]
MRGYWIALAECVTRRQVRFFWIVLLGSGFIANAYHGCGAAEDIGILDRT